MSKIVINNDLENDFINNLNYQITQKYYSFYNKIPFFNEKINELDFKMQLKETVHKIRKEFEDLRYRKSYETLIHELNKHLS